MKTLKSEPCSEVLLRVELSELPFSDKANEAFAENDLLDWAKIRAAMLSGKFTANEKGRYEIHIAPSQRKKMRKRYENESVMICDHCGGVKILYRDGSWGARRPDVIHRCRKSCSLAWI